MANATRVGYLCAGQCGVVTRHDVRAFKDGALAKGVWAVKTFFCRKNEDRELDSIDDAKALLGKCCIVPHKLVRGDGLNCKLCAAVLRNASCASNARRIRTVLTSRHALHHHVVMPFMEGDLVDLFSKIGKQPRSAEAKTESRLAVVLEVVRILQCVAPSAMRYIDMKPDNCLFTSWATGDPKPSKGVLPASARVVVDVLPRRKVSVMLADIGSLCAKRERFANYISFPDPLRAGPRNAQFACDDRGHGFGALVMLAFALGERNEVAKMVLSGKESARKTYRATTIRKALQDVINGKDSDDDDDDDDNDDDSVSNDSYSDNGRSPRGRGRARGRARSGGGARARPRRMVRRRKKRDVSLSEWLARLIAEHWTALDKRGRLDWKELVRAVERKLNA